MKRPENILSQPWEIQEYVNWLESQLAKTKGEKAKLKDGVRLLEDLAELQNGAPLVRYEEEYNKVMDKVWDFLYVAENLTQEKGEER